MQLRFAGLAAGLLSVGLAVTVNGGQRVPAPTPNPAPNPAPAPPAAAITPSQEWTALSLPTGAPRIACGMTLVPVNPRFDAVMRKPAPQKPKPSARIVPAPPCR